MTDSEASQRITHRHIEVFRAVMTAGSVTGAAQLLYTSQPTVSRELARRRSLDELARFLCRHVLASVDGEAAVLLPDAEGRIQDPTRFCHRGAEAAAAAVIQGSSGGVNTRPPDIYELRIDHPFLFAIRDTETGSILFLGRVMNPSA